MPGAEVPRALLICFSRVRSEEVEDGAPLLVAAFFFVQKLVAAPLEEFHLHMLHARLLRIETVEFLHPLAHIPHGVIGARGNEDGKWQ